MVDGMRVRITTFAAAAAACLLLWCMALAPAASASAVTGVSASVNPAQAGATSTYTINFTLDHGLVGGDQVIVFAHSGTVFPVPPQACSACAPDLSNYSLRNNSVYHDVVLDSVSFNVDGSIAYINLEPDYPGYPNDVPPLTSMTLTITGVTNPTAAGGYTLMVADSVDQTQVRSNSYTITPGPAAAVAVSSGSGQSAAVTSAFASPLEALVTDQFGNPVSGAEVMFTAPSSGPSGTFAGGSLTDTATSNSAGIATSSTFTAGTQAGAYSVQATMGTASAANFALTNVAGAPAQLVLNSGNAQSAQVGQPFGTPLAVAVLDSFGNPVSDASVNFSAPSSGASGTFTDNGSATDTAVSDSSGISSASTFTANGVLGTYTVQASTPGLKPVNFTLTNNVGPPQQILIESGNGQSAQVGQAFASQLDAEVTDEFGNPISGQSVTFGAPASGASGVFSGGSTSDTETTNASGIATSQTFTAGTVAGDYEVQATDGVVSNTFSLTNTPGPPHELLIAGGSSQSGVVGQPFAAPLEVQLADRYGNPTPVGGINVAFSSPSRGASGTFATTGTDTETDASDASGVATASTFTANGTPGAYVVQATASGLAPALLSLSNAVGPASAVTAASGDDQASEVGARFGHPLALLVTDAFGNPLAGQTVIFSLPAGGAGATFAGGSTTDTESTNSAGIATSEPLTAGHTPGSYHAQANVGTLAPVNFSLTNDPGAADVISLALQPPTILADGRSVTTATATITDVYGNPLAHENVAFATSGGQLIGAVDNHGDGTYSATVQATQFDGTAKITVTDRSVNPSVSASTQLTQIGANGFTIGKLHRDRKTGTATLVLVLPGPGLVTLSGRSVKRVTARVQGARKVTLHVRPTRKLMRKLRAHRKARIEFRVSYAPAGGTLKALNRTVTLLERIKRSRPRA